MIVLRSLYGVLICCEAAAFTLLSPLTTAVALSGNMGVPPVPVPVPAPHPLPLPLPSSIYPYAQLTHPFV